MTEHIKNKYTPFHEISLPDRKWPDKRLEKAPIWCSVDLRDGNQALINPMGLNKKLEMFKGLVKIGFKEIEVGFPAASETDYTFIRHIIENNYIPQDVTIQVLTQARKDLIERTFQAIEGVHRVIVHLYNSTSILQRKIVFKLGKKEVIDIAVNGARLIKELAQQYEETEVVYQYSPESFTGTEVSYAAEICDRVCDVYQPTLDNKIILNLPATVEMSTPNYFADQIELFCRLCTYRDRAIISLHTHNDRGTGIAASELGLMAGGDRIEGTLFGNGERTGNLDIVAMALNMFTHGINTGLDFSNIKEVRRLAEYCTELKVHERHPYAGDLVFTAFSGSHQDAIKKGFHHVQKNQSTQFEVPYFTIDPADIGRQYDPFIRVNSQSGKAGAAFLVEQHLGYELSRDLQVDFSHIVQKMADGKQREISTEEICQLFLSTYVEVDSNLKYQSHNVEDDQNSYRFNVIYNNDNHTIIGKGSGPLECFLEAIDVHFQLKFEIMDYYQHAISKGSDSHAAAYVKVQSKKQKDSQLALKFGVARDPNITKASLYALVNAINRCTV